MRMSFTSAAAVMTVLCRVDDFFDELAHHPVCVKKLPLTLFTKSTKNRGKTIQNTGRWGRPLERQQYGYIHVPKATRGLRMTSKTQTNSTKNVERYLL